MQCYVYLACPLEGARTFPCVLPLTTKVCYPEALIHKFLTVGYGLPFVCQFFRWKVIRLTKKLSMCRNWAYPTTVSKCLLVYVMSVMSVFVSACTFAPLQGWDL
jgi:hypothetical protein